MRRRYTASCSICLLVPLVSDILRQTRGNGSIFTLIIGVAAVIGGIVVIAGPQFVVSIFPIVAGVSIAVVGVYDLLDALSLKKAGFDIWKTAAILAVVAIAFGILIFANPFGTMETLVRVLGIALIYDGVVAFVTKLKA